jgi:UDP-N-acetylmuramoylalanine--D-glutamate ligase
VSSFQLDTISKFCPFISVILNVSPDHLDRYVDFDSYVNSKLKIFMNQRREDFLILNDDDSWLSAVNPKSEITVLRYGFEEKKGRRAFLKGETIKSSVAGREKMNVPIKSVKLTGKHNVSNIMAVTLCAHVLGIGESLITECIGDFKGLKNRLEWVNDIGGVSFINDSKATNLDAAIKAVMSIEQSLILIAGGLHKGADYGPLVETCKGKVKHCVFLGESKKMLADAFAGVIPYDVANDMEEAVSTAFSKSNPGDVVLLAPACSSFDMYRDYADRGESFSNAVERLKSEQGKLSQHRI